MGLRKPLDAGLVDTVLIRPLIDQLKAIRYKQASQILTAMQLKQATFFIAMLFIDAGLFSGDGDNRASVRF
jgi:hypothetical protein